MKLDKSDFFPNTPFLSFKLDKLSNEYTYIEGEQEEENINTVWIYKFTKGCVINILYDYLKTHETRSIDPPFNPLNLK